MKSGFNIAGRDKLVLITGGIMAKTPAMQQNCIQCYVLHFPTCLAFSAFNPLILKGFSA